MPEAAREEAYRRRALAEAWLPFDLARGPLLRARLFRLRETEHLLMLTLHHLLVDAWSQTVLVRELALLYDAFQAGRDSPLPELPWQYADFACRQRAPERRAAEETASAYWQRRLTNKPPLLEWPSDQPWSATTRTYQTALPSSSAIQGK